MGISLLSTADRLVPTELDLAFGVARLAILVGIAVRVAGKEEKPLRYL
jgi:hypothetical protein